MRENSIFRVEELHREMKQEGKINPKAEGRLR
jgi:hypothetical protein